jgi:hypothetical protein
MIEGDARVRQVNPAFRTAADVEHRARDAPLVPLRLAARVDAHEGDEDVHRL